MFQPWSLLSTWKFKSQVEYFWNIIRCFAEIYILFEDTRDNLVFDWKMNFGIWKLVTSHRFVMLGIIKKCRAKYLSYRYFLRYINMKINKARNTLILINYNLHWTHETCLKVKIHPNTIRGINIPVCTYIYHFYVRKIIKWI